VHTSCCCIQLSVELASQQRAPAANKLLRSCARAVHAAVTAAAAVVMPPLLLCAVRFFRASAAIDATVAAVISPAGVTAAATAACFVHSSTTGYPLFVHAVTI
jgi:hypothetical protein